MKSIEEVQARIYDLELMNSETTAEKVRIRALMEGGIAGLQALLGSDLGIDTADMPVVNFLDANLSRIAYKLGAMPTLKVPTPFARDSQRARDQAADITHIVASYDKRQKLKLQLPRTGRWLPGYGEAAFVNSQYLTPDGPFPVAIPLDPYDCYFGQWSELTQQPVDMATARRVSLATIAKLYGDKIADKAAEGKRSRRGAGHVDIVRPRIAGGSDYLLNQDPSTVVMYEYLDDHGKWVLTDNGVELEFLENPLTSGPMFTAVRRPSFGRNQSHVLHAIGLMAMFAKFNMLALTATEMSTWAETNITGEVISNGGKYQEGMGAKNKLSPGSTVARNQPQVPFQLFGTIDKIEKQIRIALNYSVIDDGISPNQWTTGRGVDSLSVSGSSLIREYHNAMGDALETVDYKRLEWDEKMYPNTVRRAEGSIKGEPFSFTYKGSDIDGLYATERIYGVMAGVDEPQKIIAFLQLLEADLIDELTVQENLDGLENLPRVNRRILERRTRKTIFAMLEQRAGQGDPAAQMALVEIHENPDDAIKILKKLLTPQEPQLSPEEEAFLQQGGGGGQPGLPQAPPDVTTVLSQLGTGGVKQGVQTVQTV